MKSLLAATALILAFGSSAFAFDGDIQSIIDRQKANKLVNVSNLAQFMSGSERWCYAEDAGSCAWSDIYLEVTDGGATFEVGNAWSETVDIAFTDQGEFVDNRYICELGLDWVPTVRGMNRADGAPIMGRELYALKTEIGTTRADGVIDCFDYLYLSSDAERQTITLLQRQYTNDVYNPANDTAVTLHFNADNAAALSWRWQVRRR